jgi:hypothetical protein
VFRQALLWVAHDIQMITCRARASMRMPLGGLATFTMLVVKAGTILRLMRSALAELKVICGQYQTALEEKRDGGPNGAKPRGLLAKVIGAQAEKHMEGSQRPVESYRAELDGGIPFVRSWLDDMEKALSSLDRYQAEDLPLRRNKDGELEARTNRPRTLHALWYSDLSPATGTAVGLFRLALAELHLREMVDSIADAAGSEGKSGIVDPLPPLPTDEATLVRLRTRVRDLLNGARRVHLRDPDWRSRSRAQAKRDAMCSKDPAWSDREKLDKAGDQIVEVAERFLRPLGRRPLDAHEHGLGGDHRIYTYWAMDAVPELRLAM